MVNFIIVVIIGLLLGLTVVVSAVLCAVILPLTLEKTSKHANTPILPLNERTKDAKSETRPVLPVTQDTTESTSTQRPDIYTKNQGLMVTLLSTITNSHGVADGKVIKHVLLKYTVSLTSNIDKI